MPKRNNWKDCQDGIVILWKTQAKYLSFGSDEKIWRFVREVCRKGWIDLWQKECKVFEGKIRFWILQQNYWVVKEWSKLMFDSNAEKLWKQFEGIFIKFFRDEGKDMWSVWEGCFSKKYLRGW